MEVYKQRGILPPVVHRILVDLEERICVYFPRATLRYLLELLLVLRSEDYHMGGVVPDGARATSTAGCKVLNTDEQR